MSAALLTLVRGGILRDDIIPIPLMALSLLLWIKFFTVENAKWLVIIILLAWTVASELWSALGLETLFNNFFKNRPRFKPLCDHACSDRLSLLRIRVKRYESIFKLRKVLIYAEKLLELVALFNNRYEGKLLEVRLQSLASIFYQGWSLYLRNRVRVGTLPWTFHLQQGFLLEDVRACWVLYVRVKLDQGFVQPAECFVFLADLPILTVKLDMHNILCVLSVVMLVHIYPCLLYRYVKRQTKEGSPLVSDIFIADLEMIQKGICVMKDLAMLALYPLSVFAHLFVAFQ